MRTVRWFLIIVPPIVVLVLAILPSTGWLVRLHVGLSPEVARLTSSHWDSSEASSSRVQLRLKQIAEQYPNDYRVQLGWALASSPFGAEVEQLRALLERFKDRPALCAHILQFSTMSDISIRRHELSVVAGGSPAPSQYPPPEVLAEFDRVAALGERLDPNNAFFPMMRAVGYFAGGRDREAVDALLRAARKTDFDDYPHDRAQSQIHLYTLAYGPQLALLQVSIQASVLWPHYSVIRNMARMGQYMATQADKAGRSQEAAEIRLALMRCGSLMRRHAPSTIGNLVGTAVTALGGYLPRPNPPSQTAQPPTAQPARRSTEQVRQEFLQYLRRLGRHEDAAWAEREFRAMDDQTSWLRQAREQRPLSPPLTQAAVDSVSTAVWSGTLLGMAVSAFVLWLVWLVLSRLIRGAPEMLFILVIGLFIVGSVLWFLPPTLNTLVLLEALVALTENEQTSAPPLITAIQNWLSTIQGIESQAALRLFATLAFLLWLVLLGGAIVVVGLIRGQSGTKALVDGLHRHLPPVVGFLLLLYVAAVVHEARVERYWSQQLARVMEHETASVLQTIGKRIPE